MTLNRFTMQMKKGAVVTRGGVALPPKPAEAPVAYPMTLTLPLPPNMANGRMHWRVKHQRRKAYLAACDQLQGAGLNPKPSVNVPDRAVISATVYHTHWSDDDNCMARLKWAVDWLVTRGYLAGDSRKHLTWSALPEQNIKRSHDPQVVVVIAQAHGAAGGA